MQGACALGVLGLMWWLTQSIVTPPAAPPVIIQNVTLIDGTGRAAQPQTDLVLADGRVARIGRGLEAPVGARFLDGSGRFAVPGLIDCHVHLDTPMVFQLTDAERARILDHNALAFLYNGVTTVLNLSSDAEWIAKKRDDQAEGRILAPRIYQTGRSFTPDGGWGSRHGGALKTAEDARTRARAVAPGVDGFKIIIEDGLDHSGTYTEMPDAMLQAIADEARAARLPMYVHAINLHEYRRALAIRPRAIVHGLEDPLPEGDSLLAELVGSGVYVVPTISLFEAFTSFEDHPERFGDPVLRASVPDFLLRNLRRTDYRAVEKKRFIEVARMDAYAWARRAVPVFKTNTGKMRLAGVKLAVGTDAGGPVGYNFQGYNTAREVELLVEVGLSPMEALVAATRTGAEVIGVASEVGTIEPGKRADLLLLSANPLNDIRNLRRIETLVQAGRVYARERFAYGQPTRVTP
jgi:imidazolonepropionase-like amidohydrolase